MIGTAVMLSFVSTSNASILSVNGQSINAYDIQKDSGANNFSEFYNYLDSSTDNGVLLPYSSNTGFEIANQIVLMVAKNGNEYGLIGLLSGRGGAAGGALMSYTTTNPLNVFVDDPNEPQGGGYITNSEIKWKYFTNRGDGFIFSGLTTGYWKIDTAFSDFSSSLKSTISVLSFDENNAPVSLVFRRDDLLTFSQINTPSSALLIMLAGFAVLRLKRMSKTQ